MDHLINDNYYKDNPEHVLGEPKKKSTAFGGSITIYEGDRQDAIDTIRNNTPSYQVIGDVPTSSLDLVKDKPLVEQERNMDEALEVIDQESEDLSEIVENSKNGNLDLISFQEIDALYNKHLTNDQKRVFVWYMRSIGRRMQGGWLDYHVPMPGGTGLPDEMKVWVEKGLVCYDGVKHLPKMLFVSGDVYDTKDNLEENSEKIIKKYGQKVFDNQMEFISESIDILNSKSLKLNDPDPQRRLRILVTDSITLEYGISNLKDGRPFMGRVSQRKGSKGQMDFKIRGDRWSQTEFLKLPLQTAFLWWLRENTDTASVRHGLTWDDLRELVIDNRNRRQTEEVAKFRTDKKNAKAECERLFGQFLAEEILDEDRVKIENAWNKKYNSILPIDYSQVPIGFSMARYYRGMEMDIRPEKREAIAASMMQGSLCIAYGVGLGKTWCAIFCMAQFMENAWASRPLLAVPLQVYPQFVKEIKGILPHIEVNELSNLSETYLSKVQNEKGETKKLNPNSISVITYHGFKQIGFSEDVSGKLLNELNEILNQGERDLRSKKSKRQKAGEKERVKGILGQALANTKVDIDKLGIDFLAIDEAHAAKKVFTSIKAEGAQEGKRGRVEYRINSGEPSNMGVKTFALAQYVQHINPTGNILLLSATPFTNSPLEVYSMLAILGYKELKKVGLNSIKNFFDKFVLVRTELVIDTALRPVHKEVFTGFANLVGLQGFIRKFFLYKQKTKGLKRPNKVVLPFESENEKESVSSIIPLTNEQAEVMTMITQFAQGNTSLPPEKVTYIPYKKATKQIAARSAAEDEAGARILMSVSLARAVALSPYLFPYAISEELPMLTYKTYIETSSKLQYTMDCVKSVKEYHEKRKEPVSGQIIYMNLGVDWFPLIKEYLVKEIGYKEHEVGIIKGTMPSYEGKSEVQDLFLGRRFNPDTKEYEDLPDEYRLKVLLGSNSITEGINLQTHCTVIYNLFLPWNPTDTVQLEGRGWRQGNQYMNIRIVYPLLEDSMDIFIFQKLGEKTQRINQIWNFDGNAAMLDLSEFDPKELKYQIIKDPFRLAEIEAEEDKEVYNEEQGIINNEIQLIEALKDDIKDVENYVSKLEDYARSNGSQEAEDLKIVNDRIAELSGFALLERAKGLKTLFNKRYRQQENMRKKHIKDNPDRGWYFYEKVKSGSRPWGYSEFLKNLQRYDYSVTKILQPRGIAEDENSVQAFIEKRTADRDEKIAKLQELSSPRYLATQAKKIQAKKDAMGVKASSVEDRAREFAKLNNLLNDKRADIVLRPASQKAKHTYNVGQSVKVKWGTRSKNGKIKALVDHHEVPMYKVQYRFGNGYEHVILETEIEPKKTKKKTVAKKKTTTKPAVKKVTRKVATKPAAKKVSTKVTTQVEKQPFSVSEIEIFEFELELELAIAEAEIEVQQAKKSAKNSNETKSLKQGIYNTIVKKSFGSVDKVSAEYSDKITEASTQIESIILTRTAVPKFWTLRKTGQRDLEGRIADVLINVGFAIDEVFDKRDEITEALMILAKEKTT